MLEPCSTNDLALISQGSKSHQELKEVSHTENPTQGVDSMDSL